MEFSVESKILLVSSKSCPANIIFFIIFPFYFPRIVLLTNHLSILSPSSLRRRCKQYKTHVRFVRKYFPVKEGTKISTLVNFFFFCLFGYLFITFYYQKQQSQEREWFSVNFKPENFVPGLIIGFILGFFLDLSKPIKNQTKHNNSLPGKRQRPPKLVSSNSQDELKMVSAGVLVLGLLPFILILFIVCNFM